MLRLAKQVFLIPAAILTLAINFPSATWATNNTPNDWISTIKSETCSVEPLSWFTPAEAWAWEQVCLDRGAYMSAVPENDSRTECRVPEEAVSPFGNILSARFIQVVNTQEPFVSAMPTEAAYFLCAHVQEELEFAFSHIPHSLWLYGFEFSEQVGFRYAKIDGLISLNHSLISKDVNFTGVESRLINLKNATIEGSVKAGESILADGLNLYQSVIGRDVKFNGATARWINFNESEISGHIYAEGATVSRNFLLIDATVHGNSEGVGVGYAIDLHDAKIGKNFAFYRANIDGDILAYRLKVGAGIYGYESTVNKLDIRSAEISHNLVLYDAKIVYLHAGSARVGGHIDMNGSQTQEASFHDSRTEAYVTIRGALNYKLNFERSSIGTSMHLRSYDKTGVFLGTVDLSSTHIGGDVQLQGSYFSGHVDLSGANIGQELILFQGNRVPIWGPDASLSLRNTKALSLAARMSNSWTSLDKSLEEYMMDRDSPAYCYHFDDSGQQMFREIVLKEWKDETDCDFSKLPFQPVRSDQTEGYVTTTYNHTTVVKEPQFYIGMDLRGFEYGTIDERLNSQNNRTQRDEELSVSSMLEWVEQSSFGLNGSQRDPLRNQQYQPQPYQKLAQLFREQGAIHKAKRVEQAMHLHRMSTYDLSLPGVFWFVADSVWGALTLFGTYPIVAVFWFALLVLCGAQIANRENRKEDDPAEPCITEVVEDGPLLMNPTADIESDSPSDLTSRKDTAYERGWLQCVWFSLENALPLVNPSEDFKDWRYHGKAQAFFNFQKFLGFVLATVLVGALTLS